MLGSGPCVDEASGQGATMATAEPNPRESGFQLTHCSVREQEGAGAGSSGRYAHGVQSQHRLPWTCCVGHSWPLCG